MRFKYFTSIVTYRIKIEDSGTCGNPEILSKFTTETYEPKKVKNVKKESVDITMQESGEVEI